MLRTDLIEVVAKGNAWAFVGSGPSTEAGCSNWKGLVDAVLSGVGDEPKNKIASDPLYREAYDCNDFPKCLLRIENVIGREWLQTLVANDIRRVSIPSRITRMLADWPFCGYITTNYDSLIENALLHLEQKGWVSVGNSDEEIRKVSGGVASIVWHIHGCSSLDKSRSQMVLTTDDYDRLYLEGSRAIQQLRSLLSQHRIVFFGFGLEDPEVMRILKIVGRLCSPTRPAFAFAGHETYKGSEEKRKELLEHFNVDVIPYQVLDGSHKQLSESLDIYGSMILRRSINFGRPPRPCPSYDAETTGLLIYNELCLKQQARLSEDVLIRLLKSRVLSLLKHNGISPVGTLVADLTARIRAIRGPSAQPSGSNQLVGMVIEQLINAGFVTSYGAGDSGPTVGLTDEGFELAANQAAKAALLAEQFSSSLLDRARVIFYSDFDAAKRVANAVESFLKDCIEKRSLGIAMARYAPRLDFQSYHVVALLQTLPEFMPQLKSNDEVVALTNTVLAILSKPNEVESKYIGLALQAKFGTHLLGFDMGTLDARLKEFIRTVFLVDSSTLISFFARSSPGYQSARLIVNQLQALKSTVLTTPLLVEEVAEHARYAIQKVDRMSGRTTVETLKTIQGKEGERSNEFLQGFINELQTGQLADSFFSYLEQAIGHLSARRTCRDDDVRKALDDKGIHSVPLDKWPGFSDAMYSQRDEKQEKIAELRVKSKTYKHKRQVKAEAEALMIISNLRSGCFNLEGEAASNAYFISHTRAIDDVAAATLPITMRPESALQWLTTLGPCKVDELSALTNSLLWELNERDLSIVDRSTLLTAFSPLIDASREKLLEQLEQNKALVAELYGEDSIKAFKETSDLEVPVVSNNLNTQIMSALQRKVEEERQRRVEAEAASKITEKEREELTILQMDKKLRQAKAKKRALKPKAKKRRKKR